MAMVQCRRPLMATRFEVWLAGDDAEHLESVGEAVLDECVRVERLLSRHDPAAEVARVNRLAAAGPILVSPELFAVLRAGRRWFDATGGAFDVAFHAGGRFPDLVRFDEARRTVAFTSPDVRLDFGGYGKGYALDAAARLLEEFGVASALLHGGTSSVLARGGPWRVGVRDPFATDERDELLTLALVDRCLSSSAVFVSGAESSDLVDPATDKALDRPAACTVVAATAVEAEVLSTALLVMGKARAVRYLAENAARVPPASVCWIERTASRTTVDWLTEPPHG